MHILLEKAPFLKAIAHQQSVIEKRAAVPILSHVMFKAQAPQNGSTLGCVTLTGTDLDITLDITFDAEVKKSGTTTLPVHMLYDIVRKLPSETPIELRTEEKNTLSLGCASSQFTLPTLSSEPFPVFSNQDPVCRFVLSACHLKRLIDETRFAMSMEEARHSLNGIYLHKSGSNLRAVATDAHRLALSWISLPGEENFPQDLPGVIISRKTVGEVRKIIEGIDAPLTIELSSVHATFTLGNSILYSRLVEGRFPDYQQAIPQNGTRVFSVRTHRFAEAVDRVSMISKSERNRFIKIRLSSGSMEVYAKSTDGGLAHERIGDLNYEGESIDMGFNARYILDVTQQIKGEFLKFSLTDPSLPALLEEEHDQGSTPQALFVLMPIRGI